MKFSDIPGQEIVKDRLRRTVREQRISHAQLFIGPQGTGKLPIALAYAQYINCKNRTELDSCGECLSCVQFSKVAHPDLHFLYPVASTKEVGDKPKSTLFLEHWRKIIDVKKGFFRLNDWYEKIGIETKQGLINVEDANDLIRKLSYTSYESEYKVMIIWMIEKINIAAANKILKMLEEPPDKTLFILISENHELIIPTIVSRTQLVKFPVYKTSEVLSGVMQLTGCEEADARNAAYLADGSLTEAIRLINDDESNSEIFLRFRGWMRACFSGDIQTAFKMSADINGKGREYMKRFLIYGLRVARLCTLNTYGLNTYLNAEGEELEFLTKFTAFINPRNYDLITKEFNDSIHHIERNANGGLVFSDISLKLIKWLKL